MPTPSGSAAKRSTPSTAALGTLKPAERGAVLDTLIAARPDLAVEAERIAVELLSAVSVEEVMSAVESAVVGIPVDALAARAGRVRGGYVHETDAAWALVDEAVEPFRSDLQRRVALGPSDAASNLVVGIVGGLHRVRDPEMGTVVAYAGEDAPYEQAAEILRLASRLGLDVPPGAAEDCWPDWADLR